MLGVQEINILDTLYGGDNGKMFQPEFYYEDVQEEFFVPEQPPNSKQKPTTMEAPSAFKTKLLERAKKRKALAEKTNTMALTDKHK